MSILYTGLDVHKKTIFFAVIKDSEPEPFIIIEKKNDKSELKKYFNKLQEKGQIICCYEAGPTGFDLYRFLKEIGINCIIAAPSLLPKKPGNRIKNDKRDAIDLAKTLRNGDIVSVHVPTESDEAVRDYIRMRGDFKDDLKKKKQQLLHFLLRHDKKYIDQGEYWTQKHRNWIKSQIFSEVLLKEVLNEYYVAIINLEDKIKYLEEKIEEIAEKEDYKNNVNKLKCFKGIDTLTSLSFVVEVSDFKRFQRAEQFMGFLGLTPSENSTGDRRRQGGITKCGNTHLRKLLTESSWHYRYYNAVSKRLSIRRKGQNPEIIAYADKAGRRLNKKFLKLTFNGKNSKIAVTAVARELSGFIWGAMTGNIN
jgi:transposase